MKKIRLNVEGMHCTSCEKIIIMGLEDIGVKANVNFKAGTVEAEFDDSKVKKEDIVKAIQKEGYKVKQ